MTPTFKLNNHTKPELPTLDLHCHLRGTLLPQRARQLAELHGIHLSGLADGHYLFRNFEEFLAIYDATGRVIRSGKDIFSVACEYFLNVATEGTKYVELMISPGHSISNGIDFVTQMSALSDAFDWAIDELGLYGCIIVTCVRHRGAAEAIEIAELAAASGNSYIRGFGLTGNELQFDIADFKGAFLIAEQAGLGLTAHAGEWLSAETVLKAVDSLNLTRVGHGISAVEKDDILLELVERGVGFEVCLSSNFRLRASERFQVHPARKMLDFGCKLAFSTDDAAYFQTTPRKELQLAKKCLGLSEDEVRIVFQASVDMAFCDDTIKMKLLRMVE